MDEVLRNMLASATCVSAAVVIFNPLDCLRIRWQVEPHSASQAQQTIATFSRQIVQAEGLVRGLWWPGLGANACGAFVCRGIGFGCYPAVRDAIAGPEKSPLAMFFAGLLSGGIGYGLSTPMWQMKTRLQASTGKLGADGKYLTGTCKGQRPLYSNFVQGMMQVARQDGFPALYRGWSALIVRGALMNSGNTLGYDGFKTEVKRRGILKDGIALHISASVIAAFFSSTFSCPADYVMTRYQTAPVLGGVGEKVGVLQFMLQLLRTDGAASFYRGWTPLFVRVAPVYCIYLPMYEQVRMWMGLGYMS